MIAVLVSSNMKVSPIGYHGVGADREGANTDDGGWSGVEAETPWRELVEPAQCSTIGMPAASSAVCTGRAGPLVSSMLTESMPTSAACRSTSQSAAAAVRKGFLVP